MCFAIACLATDFISLSDTIWQKCSLWKSATAQRQRATDCPLYLRFWVSRRRVNEEQIFAFNFGVDILSLLDSRSFFDLSVWFHSQSLKERCSSQPSPQQHRSNSGTVYRFTHIQQSFHRVFTRFFQKEFCDIDAFETGHIIW